jgi:hypothetical protein
MGLTRSKSQRSPGLRPLTKHELDRRLEQVVAELALDWPREESRSDEDKLKPHRIAPAELVRRMQKFIVYN